jgi:thioredoxin-related protein
MKRIALLSLMLVSALFADLEWVEYDEAFKKAEEKGKSVMVMLSQEECDACWYMTDIVFKNANIVAEVGNDFIPVYLNIKEDFIPDSLSYIGTPTFYFLNAKGEKIERLNGAFNVKDFTAQIRAVKAKIKH